MFFAGVLVGMGGLLLFGWLYMKHEEKKTAQALKQVAEEKTVIESENKEVENG